jgi:glycosyltransferase involved in cell wall biosynthesis
MLQDEFGDSELVDALEQLRRSPELCRRLGENAKDKILTHHAPEACARQYAEAIEAFYKSTAFSAESVIQSLASEPDFTPSRSELVQYAAALGRNHPLPRLLKGLYLDVTATYRNDLKTGIERVSRALTLALLATPPYGYRVEPVYLSLENGRWLYRHARRYTLELSGCPQRDMVDEVVELEANDVLLGLDLSGSSLIQAAESGLFTDFRNSGVKVYATVFDLLPIRLSEVFPPGADQLHHNWLAAISSFDGAICISRSVADDLRAWQNEEGITWERRRPYSIDWFHMGADVENSAPSNGMPPAAAETVKYLKARPSFLMVGTIEPRKGYLQILDAFEELWSKGENINLVIVGREGWKGLPNEMRRDIPETVERLLHHPELNSRLFWLEAISDEYLEKIYASCICLIAASYGEGFGLPLIEAAQHRLPIVARNIPVFREVAGEFAFFFDANTSEELAQSLRAWLHLFYRGENPTSDGIPWLTWKESAHHLATLVCGGAVKRIQN